MQYILTIQLNDKTRDHKTILKKNLKCDLKMIYIRIYLFRIAHKVCLTLE